MLDHIFGENAFQNEIIWKRTGARGDAKGWNQIHDTLFLFSGGGLPTWNPQFNEYSDHYLKTKSRTSGREGSRTIPVRQALPVGLL